MSVQNPPPDPTSPPPTSLSAVLRLLPFLKPYRKPVILGMLCLLGQIAAELFPPLVWKYVVDTFLETRDLSQLGWAVVALLVAYAANAAFSGFRTFQLTRAAQGLVLDLRKAVYSRLQQQPLAYFQSRRTGDLLSRAVNDVDIVQDVLVSGADNVLASLLRIVGVAFIFITLQPILGMATIFPMFLVGLALGKYNRRVKGIYRRVRGQLGEVTAKLQDNLGGISVIKSFAREEHEEEEFAQTARAYYNISVEGIALRSRFYPSVRFVANLGQVIMLGLGAYLIYLGSFTIGGLVAYRGYGRYFYGPIDQLMNINEMLQRAAAGAERILEVLDTEPTVQDAPDAVEMPRIHGDVTFRQVSFAYRPDQRILEEVDFEIPAGSTVGVFGGSGVGKTTLLNLIPRFYDPIEGAVLIDGIDLRGVTQNSIRRQIGVVQQDTFLFNGTVLDNIRYGWLDATDEQVIEAAQMANADSFIQGLPDGYLTEIGERGAKLSGGQRQRVSIARCFLADPRILLMDEPTSAVEPESERLILESLRNLSKGRTSFLVSHRLSMLRQADIILCLENGRLAARGKHEELISRYIPYAESWATQAGLEVG